MILRGSATGIRRETAAGRVTSSGLLATDRQGPMAPIVSEATAAFERTVRIRFYGFLAPRCRTEALSRCRYALDASPPPVPAASAGDTTTPVALPPCPHCGGAMVAIERLTARPIAVQAFIKGLAFDSS